jgi:hypothetical protein
VTTSFSWTPHIEQELKRMAVRNLTPRYRAALSRVTCPDHGHSPTISEYGLEWHIERCCERAEAIAFEAIRKAGG